MVNEFKLLECIGIYMLSSCITISYIKFASMNRMKYKELFDYLCSTLSPDNLVQMHLDGWILIAV